MKNDARKKNALEFYFCGSCLYKIYIPKHSLSIEFLFRANIFWLINLTKPLRLSTSFNFMSIIFHCKHSNQNKI